MLCSHAFSFFFWLSQGSVPALSRWGGKFTPAHVSFTAKSNSENYIKIRWFLTKLQRKICWLLFMAQGVERPQLRRTDPLSLIYSFQFRSAFSATATSSQPQLGAHIRRPLPSLTDNLLKLIVVQIYVRNDTMQWTALFGRPFYVVAGDVCSTDRYLFHHYKLKPWIHVKIKKLKLYPRRHTGCPS